MGDWSNAALQTVFWNCANILRREAKLCDIVLYVQNRRGFMVGHPAHKILLISTSKYFKLLFEREDLRNFCHFPHLNEEGLVSVLDIIYGRELHENTNLEDALLAARFLQVDIAIETLEKKQKKKQSQKSNQFTNSENISRSGSTSSDLDKSYTLSVAAAQDTAEVRLFRNVKNTESESTKTESKKRKVSSTYKEQQQQDSQMTDSEMSPSQGEPVSIKIEPDIDLTEEGDSSFNVSLPQISFVQGGDDVVDDDNGQTFMYPTEPGSADTSFDSSSMGFSSQMMDPNVNFMSANNSDGSTGFQGENMTGKSGIDRMGTVRDHYSIFKMRAGLRHSYKNYEPADLQEALKMIQIGKLSRNKAAMKYGVPPSTLRNKLRELRTGKKAPTDNVTQSQLPEQLMTTHCEQISGGKCDMSLNENEKLEDI